MTTGELRDRNRKMTAVVRERRRNSLFQSRVTTFSLRKDILSLNAKEKKDKLSINVFLWFPRIKNSKAKAKNKIK